MSAVSTSIDITIVTASQTFHFLQNYWFFPACSGNTQTSTVLDSSVILNNRSHLNRRYFPSF